MDELLTKLRLEAILRHISLVKDDLVNMSLEDFKKFDLHVRATCFSMMQIGE